MSNCSNHEIKNLEEIMPDFLRCPLCKIAMKRQEWETEINKNNTPWYKEVALNSDMWHKEAFTEFPYVIAHEYKRLHDMISNGEIYGSIMQLKDAFEIGLKFPIIVILEGCEKKIREIAEKAYMDNDEEDYDSKTQSENARESNNKELKKFDIDSFKEKHNDLFYIVNTVLSKALALGDWEQIGKHAAKLNIEEDMPQNAKNIYAAFIKIIKKIVDKFNTYKITNWRNDTIGHGALALEDIDNKFQEEIKKLLKALKETLALCKECYNQIGFYTNESFLLSGNSIDINFDEIKSFKVQLKENANDFVELDPYLVHQASKLYVMDSFNKNKRCAKVLNYSHGDKIYHNPLAQRLESINKALNVAAVPSADVMNANLDPHQREKFEKLMFDKVILKPTHMHDKLLSCLDRSEKGIFLFRGERGTGKTVFTNAIDELGSSSYTNDKHRIPGVMVRAWHFNSIYNSRIDSFKGGIIGKLGTKVENVDGNKVLLPNMFQGTEIEQYCAEFICETTPDAREFAKILGYIKDFYEVEKLLIILDGIDEIKITNEITGLYEEEYKEKYSKVSIFDFIPGTKDLSEGVFFLITSRTKKELEDNKYITEGFEKLKITEEYEFDRNNSIYREIIKKYTKKYILKINDEEMKKEIKVLEDLIKNNKDIEEHTKKLAKIKSVDIQVEEILEDAQYRFIYLNAYKKLYECNIDINADNNNLLGVFCDNIKKSSYAYYDKVLRFMMILALAEEGENISLKEMAYLMGEETITFRLMGIIHDMRSFIDFERSAVRGNLICISHKEWRENILSFDNEKKKEIIEDLRQMFNSFVNGLNIGDNIAKSDYDGETWLAANIVGIVKPKDLNDVKVNLEKVIIYYNKTLGYIIKRYIKTLASLIEVLIRMQHEGDLEDSNDLARTFFEIAHVHYRTKNVKEAIKNYDSSIKIMEELYDFYKEEKNNFNPNDLASAYMNRGVAYSDKREVEKAIEDYDASIKIREELYELYKEGKVNFDPNDLASAYMNRGVAYSDKREVEKAIEDYEAAIRIRKALCLLHIKGKVNFDFNHLATVYINRGNAYNDKREFEKAIKDFEVALNIRKKLYLMHKNEKREFDVNHLAIAYENIAVAYTYNREFGKAIENYDYSIKIMEELYELYKKGKVNFDPNTLALAYMNRGVACVCKIESGETRVCRNKKELEIAITYRNKKEYKRELDKAIENYDSSLIIMEDLYELYKKGEINFDPNDLASAYMSRATAYSYKREVEKAIEDYNASIKIIEELYGLYKNKKINFDPNDMATAYMNLGIFYFEMDSNEYYKKSLELSKKARNILKEIVPKIQYLQENLIKVMFIECVSAIKLGVIKEHIHCISACFSLIKSDILDDAEREMIRTLSSILSEATSQKEFNEFTLTTKKVSVNDINISIPQPNPKFNPEEEARKNIEYQEKRREWEKLPLYKKLITKKPTRPN